MPSLVTDNMNLNKYLMNRRMPNSKCEAGGTHRALDQYSQS